MIAFAPITAWFAARFGRRDALDGDDYLPEGDSVEIFTSPWFGTEELPAVELPRTRKEQDAIFGIPGAGKVDRKWERANMVIVRDLPIIGKKYVHRLAEPYFREALRRCELAGLAHEIEKFGCWAFRHQRHDPRRPLSDHAYGIACDINPQRNRARKYPAGNPPKPWSEEWRHFWPHGVSRQLVEIFEAVGFEWGGRWQRFVDPMHFSLRRVP